MLAGCPYCWEWLATALIFLLFLLIKLSVSVLLFNDVLICVNYHFFLHDSEIRYNSTNSTDSANSIIVSFIAIDKFFIGEFYMRGSMFYN